ncbi:sensor domain-containing diguanylate cyclase [Blastococcus sp. TML/M2B]|uniref:sensor domain-containing diguanylate cyclase n=1 Tax=unclassified Blastococcus TaxID=2619396 RepID=UPI00190DDDC6|nr:MULTISPECIES: sensor domain-containing diguanylate cyclase [unclassified Blastococcus]MBN1094239.1 sensor domain-containing diguanylate cyclase [Blastococcus sp. TML/M2B]MBN1095640.1 sensor domain-containing diguanylate cyclase [Blastococcus sp. TML/C7B]
MTAARSSVATARETSGVTTAGLLTYVAVHGEPDAVARLLELAGVSETAEELCDQSRWFSYATRVRLFSAATEVLGDPDVMFHVGQAALRSGMAHSLELVLRALGSPRQVFRRLPRAVAKFTTVSSMEILEITATSARLALHLHEGYEHSALDCDFSRGLATTVPELFGLPTGVITAAECRTGDGRTCVCEVTWERRSRLRRRGSRAEVHRELAALRGQLRTLQDTATELAGSDDLDTVLRLIVARAGQAVLAPAHLLAVAAPGGGAPLVHSAGLPDDEAQELARRLLAGEDLGPRAVVVDVASARRRHGRLAAVYPSGDGSMADEQAMLAAYAAHAAAALELLFALDDARLEADRAGALLHLAHELAAADAVDGICQVVANALPRVVGSEGASVMLWDPSAGQLRARASANVGKPKQAAFFETPLSPEDSPEVLELLSNREPRLIRGSESSPVLRALLAQIGVADVIALPLVADGNFLGIATASWTSAAAPEELTDDVLVRLRGVGDQAVSALQRAQLLETVRHQAHHDALTGLPNRVLFLERLLAELPSAGPGAQLGVLFCDLDRFKQVNDALGHAAGDELLRQVAARLRAAIRPCDTVGRLSGDEFAIILPGLDDEADAHGLAARVVDCFAEPFRLEGREVAVGTSVGVAVHHPGGDAEELLRRADAAMYRHKQGQGSARPAG